MLAPLTVQQIALYKSKRRAGTRQEVAAAAAGISVSSAHRIVQAACNPKPLNPVDGGVKTRWPRSGIHCYSRCWSAIRT